MFDFIIPIVYNYKCKVVKNLQIHKKKEVVKTVSSDGKKRKGRRTMSGRMFRSALATYQIDMVDKLVDDAFEIFTK